MVASNFLDVQRIVYEFYVLLNVNYEITGIYLFLLLFVPQSFYIEAMGLDVLVRWPPQETMAFVV